MYRKYLWENCMHCTMDMSNVNHYSLKFSKNKNETRPNGAHRYFVIVKGVSFVRIAAFIVDPLYWPRGQTKKKGSRKYDKKGDILQILQTRIASHAIGRKARC